MTAFHDPTLSSSAPGGLLDIPTHAGAVGKWLIAACGAISFAACGWFAGRVGLTTLHGFNGSLLLSSGPIGNTIIAAILTFASIAIGTVLAGRVRPDAGLFAGACGLAAIALRSPSIDAVYHETHGARSSLLFMAVELAMLAAMFVAGWVVLRRIQSSGGLSTDSARDGLADVDPPPNATTIALGVQVLLTLAVVTLVCRSEDKKQAMAAVGLAGFLAAFFQTESVIVRPGALYPAGTLLAGVLGYLINFFIVPASLDTGRPAGGFLNALARPQPLHYASFGVIGALLGYWMRRKSLRDRALNAAESR